MSIRYPRQDIPLQLCVRVVKQTSGAFEHVVIFDAELYLFDNTSEIELIFIPSASRLYGVEPRDEQIAVDFIKKGIQDVLAGSKLGALVQISGLRIHPVDFIPEKFREYTASHLVAAIEARLYA